MNVEKCKSEVLAHCAKYEKLTEESILKIKILKSKYTPSEVEQGVQAALDQLGSNLVFSISQGKTHYRVLDTFTRGWIIRNSLAELRNYSSGEITIRGLHYRMVARGMTNSDTHYARVKSAMVFARRDGQINYDQFSDYERETIGTTEADTTDVDSRVNLSGRVMEHYLKNYTKNKWENQPYYPEIWIEKKALIGVFERLCSRNSVLLSPCKGYPSLTFLKDAADRFEDMQEEGKKVIILYFGDYDASGEDIPRSIKDNLLKDFDVEVEVRRVLLMENHVIEMGLPPAPTKAGDSRGNTWTGLGQVELDSVEPKVIQRYCQEAIDEILDEDLYDELMEQEAEERKEYRIKIKEYVQNYEFGDE